MHYLVTIDRDEYSSSRKFEVWKPSWWRERVKGSTKLGRKVFCIDRERETGSVLFELDQSLNSDIWNAQWRNQKARAKAFARGLRTLIQTKDGGFVICDNFGVYETTPTGEIKRYLSLPTFAHLHSALPNAEGTRILVTSAGVEEAQEVDWEGNIYRRIAMHDVFDTAMAPGVAAAKRGYSDYRLIPLMWQKELYHLNWAEWLEEGVRMVVSCYIPGIIAILRFTGNQECTVERQWGYFPRCHAPTFDFQRGTLLVALSATDQVREIDLETKKVVWKADNIRFCKDINILDDKRALACDCTGRRLVELDRNTGKELWSYPLPGDPYSVEIIRKQ